MGGVNDASPAIYIGSTHMTDLTARPDSNVSHDPGSTAGMPRWVKVSAIIGLILVLLFVILHFAGLHGVHTH